MTPIQWWISGLKNVSVTAIDSNVIQNFDEYGIDYDGTFPSLTYSSQSLDSNANAVLEITRPIDESTISV